MDTATPQLVTASACHLRVYRTNAYVLERNSATASAVVDDVEWLQTTKLECMLSVPMLAPIRSMAAARIPNGNGLDLLFVAFDDAKLSVLAYDQRSHELITVSMHAFEDALLRGGYTRALQSPLVVTDVDSRCAAMLVYGRHLAIVPLTLHSQSAFDRTAVDMNDSSCGNLNLDRHSLGNQLDDLLYGAKLHAYVTQLTEIDERLHNVADLCFLYGYYEPTLLLLYEPLQTTVGRLAIRYDTYCILAVSLNTREQQHAVIWTVTQLPYDALRVQPVPRPVGGCVLTCANAVIYLNQSVPAYGVCVNGGYRQQYTSFPMHSQAELRLPLEASASDFLSPTCMLLACRDQRAVTCSLLIDELNTVRGVRVEELTGGNEGTPLKCTPPTCMTTLPESSLVFVGSYLTDSLLLAFAEQTVHPVQVTSEPTQPRAFDSAPNVEPPQTADDTDIYGDALVGGTQQRVDTLAIIQYHLEVWRPIPDQKSVILQIAGRLVHVGPLKSACLAAPAATPEPLRHNRDDLPFDTIYAAGTAPNASIVVHQRSLRPNIVTSTPLPGARQLHTCGRVKHEHGGTGEALHKYLLVARDAITMVLETSGTEGGIHEVDASPFIIDETTIAAVDLHQHEYILQVTPMHLCLVGGDSGAQRRRLQIVSLEISFPVRYVSSVDNYVLLITENGQLLLVELMLAPAGLSLFDSTAAGDENTLLNVTKLATMSPQLAANGNACACLYKDTSGLFVRSEGSTRQYRLPSGTTNAVAMDNDEQMDTPVDTTANDEDSRLNDFGGEFDDEDAMLYGTAASLPGETSRRRKSSGGGVKVSVDSLKPSRRTVDALPVEHAVHAAKACHVHDPQTVTPTYWLAVVRGAISDGGHAANMDVFALPSMELVYSVPMLAQCARVLTDMDTVDLVTAQTPATPMSATPYVHTPVADTSPDGLFGTTGSGSGGSANKVIEIILVSMGANGARPHLFVLHADLTLAVQVGRLCIRWRRSTSCVLRNARTLDALTVETPLPRYLFTVDSGIGRYYNTAVFAAGAYPHWALMETNELRIHPMNLEVPLDVITMTPFNYGECVRGFVYAVCSGGQFHSTIMRVCMLDARFDYDACTPTYRHTVPATHNVHHVAYLLDSHTLAVCTARTVVHDKIYEMVGDDKSSTDVVLDVEENLITPTVERYEVGLHNVHDMQRLENAGHIELEEYETVTCLKEVQLRSEASQSGTANYVGVSTIHNYGEEVLVRGRLFILEVIEVVPEPGEPSPQHRLKTLLCRDEKAPVTCLCSMNSYLLTGTGQKVYIWSWRDNELHGISFIDMSFYIHQMVGLHNLCATADVQRGVAVLRFQEYEKALSVAARDYRPLRVQAMPMSVDFCVDGRQIGVVMGDEDDNLSLFVYAPETRESCGGQRLLSRGDMHIGARVACIMRVQSHVTDPICGAQDARQMMMSRHVNILGTLDAGTAILTPLSDRVFRKLVMLQSMLVSQLTHVAGINPRQARHARGLRSIKCGVPNPAQRNIIDGDVVFAYMHLSATQQADIAKRLGTTRQQLNDELLAIYRSITHS